MFIGAPEEGISTCRSQGPNGELIERTHDYVIASQSVQEKIKNMKVAEDVESRPHKVVTFPVERDTEIQDWLELNVPKALTGFSGGKSKEEAVPKEDEKKKRKRRCERLKTR